MDDRSREQLESDLAELRADREILRDAIVDLREKLHAAENARMTLKADCDCFQKINAGLVDNLRTLRNEKEKIESVAWTLG